MKNTHQHLLALLSLSLLFSCSGEVLEDCVVLWDDLITVYNDALNTEWTSISNMKYKDYDGLLHIVWTLEWPWLWREVMFLHDVDWWYYSGDYIAAEFSDFPRYPFDKQVHTWLKCK